MVLLPLIITTKTLRVTIQTNMRNRSISKNRKIILLLIIEFIILLSFLFVDIIYRNKHCRMIEGFSVENYTSDIATFENGLWSIAPQNVNTEEDTIVMLKGSGKELKRGTYTLIIRYHADSDQKCNIKVNDDDGLLINGGTFILDKNKDQGTFHFETKTNIKSAYIEFWYNRSGSFSISDIAVYSNDNMIRKFFLILFFILLGIDTFLIFRILSSKNKRYLLTIVILTVISSLPLFYKGLNDKGHDLIFHLMRIEGLAEEIRLRHIPSRMQSLWNGGYGYPVSIYYGDILLYFPAILRLFGISINGAFKLYVFGINLLTSLSAFICFKKVFVDYILAVFLSFVFVLSPYRLMDIFVRNAVGEYSVMVFFPIITLALYRIYDERNQTWKQKLGNGILLGIGTGGVVTSHVLSAEMIILIMGITFILLWKKSIKPDSLITYFIGTAVSILLSLYYIVPFLDYNLHCVVKISRSSPRIQAAGANISDYFAFFNNPYGDSPYMKYTPGFILMISIMFAFVMWIKKKANSRIKLLTILSLFLLWIDSNAFPWDVLAYDIRPFRVLTYVQFPWRYMGIICLTLTLLLGELLTSFLSKETPFPLPVSLKTIINAGLCSAVLSMLLFLSSYADNANRTVYYDTGNLSTYSYMGGEYLRAKRAGDKKIVTDPKKFKGEVTGNIEYSEILERNGTDITFSVNTGNAGGEVVFPVINYPGYCVSDEYGNRYEIHDSDNLLIAIDLPASYKGILRVSYDYPRYWDYAAIISIVAFLVIISAIIAIKLKPVLNNDID